MKKLLLLTLSLIFALTLSSCGSTEQAESIPTPPANDPAAEPAASDPVSAEATALDCLLKLHADKSVYSSDEAIQVHATLEYIGEKESLTVDGCSSILAFSITNGDDFNMLGAVNTISVPYHLEKGTEYTTEFYKSGGWSESDPMADFWEEFYAQEELFLPPGTYTVEVNTTFSGGPSCSIQITVT